MFNNPATAVDSALSLADFTSDALMLPELRQRDTAGVIQELSQLLHQQGRMPDVLPFYHAALNREFLVSTATDYGMAFPHARLNGLTRLWFALGRSSFPIPWGSQDPKMVWLVFLLAAPATEAAGYLHIVSGLARLGKDSRLMAALRDAPDAAAMFAVLRQVGLPHSRGAIG
jgi:mannitol/fructose-specific phosphotransferase system IIA component (Ntr-type)